MENFDQPYWSRNVTTFWRKWHISLSGWFYDYLFNPIVLTLRNKGKTAIVLGLLITFFISGFWHGAGWRFILFGLIHGFALVFEYFTKKTRQKLFKALPAPIAALLGISATFGYTLLAWVFFRAENMHKAIDYLKAMLAFRGGSHYVGMNRVELVFSFMLIAITLWREKAKPSHHIANNKLFYTYFALMAAICYFFGVFIENQFIYFQF
jgi:D-alanyl-lipoteichoic acid acyltransferase DltB (MBOAT superfamily)